MLYVLNADHSCFCTSVAAGSPANATIVAPNNLLNPPPPANNTLNIEGTETDVDTIVSTAHIVDQKSGAPNDAPPDQPPPPTTVTAVDGQLMNETIPTNATRRSLYRRLLDGYQVVFEGTGMGSSDRDASIQGTAYLTYTLIPNNTYNVDDCLRFCDSVKGCGKPAVSITLRFADLIFVVSLREFVL